MDKIPRIGMAWQMNRRYGQDAIRGIAEYANRYGPWLLLLDSIEKFDSARIPEFAGILLGYDDLSLIGSINWPRNIPIVSIHQTLATIAPWQVQPDNVAVGLLVAREFIGRGFRNFAFCPTGNLDDLRIDSDRHRLEGFVREARKINPDVSVCEERPTGYLGYEQQWESTRMGAWIRSLPKPVGIMASNDPCARHVLLSAAAAGIRVPEEAAVIGVGNEVWAEVALRGLSSVELDGFRAGYVAADLLHQLIQGRKVKPGITRISPRRLITRRSSSTVAIDDPDVVLAVHFIAERATEGIDVEDVVQAVPLSRRALERHFERALGRSILQEIRTVQIERAKLLLADDSIPLRRVAQAAGFASADTLNSVFHRLVGTTPLAYRRSIADRADK